MKKTKNAHSIPGVGGRGGRRNFPGTTVLTLSVWNEKFTKRRTRTFEKRNQHARMYSHPVN